MVTSDGQVFFTTEVATPSVTVGGLQPGLSYHMTTAAVNKEGKGPSSAPFLLYVNPDMPSNKVRP